jgi:hypothetical protein
MAKWFQIILILRGAGVSLLSLHHGAVLLTHLVFGIDVSQFMRCELFYGEAWQTR